MTALRLLLVEDEPADARIVESLLRKVSFFYPRIHCAPTLRDALTQLESSAFDVLIVDLKLPDATGLEIVEALRRRTSAPIVVLTGMTDPSLGVRAIRASAEDCLSKHDLTSPQLSRAILYAIERHRRLDELSSKNRTLERLANLDPLTRVLNRRGLERTLTRFSRMNVKPVSAVLVDCDDFKFINDRHSHAAGDEVLREIARRLSKVVRESDAIARIGGDEFLIALPGTPSSTAAGIAERARDVVRADAFSTVAGLVEATVSASFATAPDPLSIGALLLQLHGGLATAKTDGGDAVFESSDLPVVTFDAEDSAELGNHPQQSLHR